MPLQNELDADFFRMIHQTVASRRREARHERRGDPRNPFDCVQRVAPWDGREFPADSQFTSVRCHDLNQRGFSFLSDRRPDFDKLVVALQTGSHVIHVAAEVAHTAEVWHLPSDHGPDGQPGGSPAGMPGTPSAQGAVPMVLVGCRFTHRLDKPPGVV